MLAQLSPEVWRDGILQFLTPADALCGFGQTCSQARMLVRSTHFPAAQPLESLAMLVKHTTLFFRTPVQLLHTLDLEFGSFCHFVASRPFWWSTVHLRSLTLRVGNRHHDSALSTAVLGRCASLHTLFLEIDASVVLDLSGAQHVRTLKLAASPRCDVVLDAAGCGCMDAEILHLAGRVRSEVPLVLPQLRLLVLGPQTPLAVALHSLPEYIEVDVDPSDDAPVAQVLETLRDMCSGVHACALSCRIADFSVLSPFEFLDRLVLVVSDHTAIYRLEQGLPSVRAMTLIADDSTRARAVLSVSSLLERWPNLLHLTLVAYGHVIVEPCGGRLVSFTLRQCAFVDGTLPPGIINLSIEKCGRLTPALLQAIGPQCQIQYLTCPREQLMLFTESAPACFGTVGITLLYPDILRHWFCSSRRPISIAKLKLMLPLVCMWQLPPVLALADIRKLKIRISSIHSTAHEYVPADMHVYNAGCSVEELWLAGTSAELRDALAILVEQLLVDAHHARTKLWPQLRRVHLVLKDILYDEDDDLTTTCFWDLRTPFNRIQFALEACLTVLPRASIVVRTHPCQRVLNHAPQHILVHRCTASWT